MTPCLDSKSNVFRFIFLPYKAYSKYILTNLFTLFEVIIKFTFETI